MMAMTATHTLLLVDDDRTLRQTLAIAIKAAGYDIVVAHHGQEALAFHDEQAADLIVSDVNMPFMDGFTLCRTLRERGDNVPLILLTSRDSEIDEVLGLDLGADDYVTKPFSMRVLLSRVRTLLRRGEVPKDQETNILQHGELRLDMDRFEVRFAGVLMTLTVTEVRLFEALINHAGRVMSRQRLLELGRGEEGGVVAPRLIDTYIGRMRRKLKAVGAPADLILTVVGAGYRLQER